MTTPLPPDAPAPPTPDRLVAVARWEPAAPGAPATLLQGPLDAGGFGARLQGDAELVILRPTRAALRIERAAGAEVVAWDDVAGIDLTSVAAAQAPSGRVACVRIRFRGGPSLDLADAATATQHDLPMSLEPAGPVLLRVERLRLLTAAVAAAAGLAPRDRETLHRGGRGVPVPDLVPRPRRLPRWVPPVSLAASVAVLFLILPGQSWWGAIAVTVALIWHEAGHALALRWAGIPVRRMIVLPALGAATVPDRGYETRWDDAWVALAGPCTGIPVAIAAVLLWHEPPPEPVRWGLFVAVALGLLNLAPFIPLDGGRVLLALVAGLPRSLRAVAVYLPLVLLLGGMLAVGYLELTLAVAAIVALTIATTRLALRRQITQEWVLALGVPSSAVRRALWDVTHGLDGDARDDVDGGVPPEPLTRLQAAAVIAGYGVLVVSLGAAAASLVPIIPEMGKLPGLGDGG